MLKLFIIECVIAKSCVRYIFHISLRFFQIISKDTNVMIVALGGRLLGMVASGLRAKFSPYAVACVQAILEKFKEKKTNVVTALREAIDAIYPSVSIFTYIDYNIYFFN